MIRRVLLLAASALLPLCAQESLPGVRVHALSPAGDLRDATGGKPGLGAGAFLSIPLGRGLVLRPLVGFQTLLEGDAARLPGTRTQGSSLDLMVEGLWYPDEDLERGAYLVGAIGGQQWRIRTTGAAPGTLTATRLGLSGGVGYQFTPRLGAEARGFWSPVDPTLTATGLMLVATLRF